MSFKNAQSGMKIEYIGDSIAYGGTYTMLPAESTYYEASNCPEHERGRLVIYEFMNNGDPIFIMVDELNPDEWRVA